ITDLASSRAGYRLKLSTVAVISGVVKVKRVGASRTSSFIKAGFIRTVNFVPAGQVPSGANDKLLDPRKCHVPRINGVIFTWSDKSASTRFILNAGAYGPDSSVYEIIASAGGVSSRSLFTSGMLFWVAKNIVL